MADRGRDAAPACPAACCSFGASCGWGAATDAASCADLGGSPGLPGAACDAATGACAPPPTGPGSCCAFGGGAQCFGGPNVQPLPCGELGGTFATGALCDAALGCVMP